MVMFKHCQSSKDIHSKYSQWPNGQLPYGNIAKKKWMLEIAPWEISFSQILLCHLNGSSILTSTYFGKMKPLGASQS